MSDPFDLAPDPALTTDRESAKAGIEVKCPPDPNFPDSPRTIIVAQLGGYNTAFQQAYEAHRKPFEHILNSKTRKLEPDVEREMLVKIYADGCVRGFSGWRNTHGDEVPYSKEAARALLRAYDEIFDIVIEVARERSNFSVARKLEAIEQGKNELAGS